MHLVSATHGKAECGVNYGLWGHALLTAPLPQPLTVRSSRPSTQGLRSTSTFLPPSSVIANKTASSSPDDLELTFAPVSVQLPDTASGVASAQRELLLEKASTMTGGLQIRWLRTSDRLKFMYTGLKRS